MPRLGVAKGAEKRAVSSLPQGGLKSKAMASSPVMKSLEGKRPLFR